MGSDPDGTGLGWSEAGPVEVFSGLDICVFSCKPACTPVHGAVRDRMSLAQHRDSFNRRAARSLGFQFPH